MVRLIALTLDGIRNISHGVITFDDLETGGSVTGIYGQNGSGKTCVIDAIDILRSLIAGRRLFEDSGDAINADAHTATITALYRTAEDETTASYVEYAVTLEGGHEDRIARVIGEELRIGNESKTYGGDPF